MKSQMTIMAKATYTPLYFAQLMDVLTCPENTLTTILRRVISEGDDIMRFLWFDTDFMDSDYNGPYRYLNDFLAKHRSKLYGSFTVLFFMLYFDWSIYCTIRKNRTGVYA